MLVDYKDWIVQKVVVDPETKGGNATFRGTRVTLQQVAELAKKWVTYSYLFEEFPFLTTLDIQYAVKYYNNEHNTH